MTNGGLLIFMRKDNILQSEGITIIVPSSLENLSLMRALAKTYLVSKSLSDKDIFRLLTVIDELATNASTIDTILPDFIVSTSVIFSWSTMII